MFALKLVPHPSSQCALAHMAKTPSFHIYINIRSLTQLLSPSMYFFLISVALYIE
jgi:hypothetical protein